MTKKEHEQIKAWNIAQGEAKAEAEAAYDELRAKYHDINGYANCGYANFLAEVATCKKVSEAERMRDIYTIVKYHEARGRYEALYDYITVK